VPLKFKGIVGYIEPPAATYAACPVVQPPFPGGPLSALGMPLTLMAWNGTLGTAPAGEPPRITFNLPALSDPESGVISYKYKVTEQPEATYSSAGWTAFNPAGSTFLVEGSPLNYTGQFYLSVVAMNTAGLVSQPIVSAPFRVPDPTNPTAPEICATVGTTAGPASFSVSFNRHATDDETQVSGYQYRVRTDAGAVVRNWPASGVDWSGTSATGQGTAALSVTGGQRYYVDVRAVNGQGMVSGWVTSGPILYDNTPPPSPVPAIAAVPGFPLFVTVGVPADPESGTTILQWAVGTSATTADIAGWQAMSVSASSMTFQVPGPSAVSGVTYWVRVRTVNGAGATSAIVTAASPPAQIVGTIQPRIR
jgi:predicted phage tail protein